MPDAKPATIPATPVQASGKAPVQPKPDDATGIESTLHASTFDYLKPTDTQLAAMTALRAAAKAYSDLLDKHLPPGPDKTYVLRAHRQNAMWVNVAITRHADGAPRTE